MTFLHRPNIVMLRSKCYGYELKLFYPHFLAYFISTDKSDLIETVPVSCNLGFWLLGDQILLDFLYQIYLTASNRGSKDDKIGLLLPFFFLPDSFPSLSLLKHMKPLKPTKPSVLTSILLDKKFISIIEFL